MKRVDSKIVFIGFLFLFISFLTNIAFSQDNETCLMCHDDVTLKGTINGRTVSVYVNSRTFNNSVHNGVDCIDCHIDVDPEDIPHRDELTKVNCGLCHDDIQEMFSVGLHGKAVARNDRLAPTCQTCHGKHDILSPSNRNSNVYPMNVPVLCGSCHKEGGPVQRYRNIPKDSILENYSQSIHGEGLLQKGLIVSANCADCHTAHIVLPHTDPRSSIARQNIAETCTACHVEIEEVHKKIIAGERWEKEAHVLPACVDCHQPHKIRNAFYEQGMANRDCLVCHEKPDLVDSTGQSMFVDVGVITGSRHFNIACSQCHTGVTPSHERPCISITEKVDCSSCHAEVGDNFERSIHGQLLAKNDDNAPRCKDCHGDHGVLGTENPISPVFPTNVPNLCGECHKHGEEAAIRYTGTEKEVVEHYVESIHGKGLLQSGLTVTATCSDCHTSHLILPHDDPESSVNKANIHETCGNCHHGIEDKFMKSVHSPLITPDREDDLPTCEDCHSAHSIRRADQQGFKLEIMDQCGRCHEAIADTYFDTYHGKVSQLGYTKTAKCYDCHGSHDILPTDNPASRLSRQNVVNTCKQCHPSANRQFAGYFTHATHHDPDKYPFLFWTFWGMTGLLVVTFFVAGLHTVLWLPRSLKWRRELKKRESNQESSNSNDDTNSKTDNGKKIE